MAGPATPSRRQRLGRPLQAIKTACRHQWDLLQELGSHQFFRQLENTDWRDYQIGPIIVSSILINLLELGSPLYINILYTVILPTRSTSSLLLLTAGVVVLLIAAGWLRSVRGSLTGSDGARMEHHRRMEALGHMLQLPLEDYLREPPTSHGERLNSINLLRDDSAIQAFTTAIDLAFSLLFVVVLFLIGGSLGLIAIAAILIYLFRSLRVARDFELLSRRKDSLELQRMNDQAQLMGAVELIKANGLGRSLLRGLEERQERVAWERLHNNVFTSQYQAFGSLMGQVTMAGLMTWGACLVIAGRLPLGALAASLLLGSKVLQPWQQALGLWSSYRRLIHARDQLDGLMATPTEAAGGPDHLDPGQALAITWHGQALPTIPAGSSALVQDSDRSQAIREFLLGLLQIGTAEGLELNGQAITSYRRDQLRQAMAYVDPSQGFFEGTLLENLTAFQPELHGRRALFWCVLMGVDQRIRNLSEGYNTPLGINGAANLSGDLLAQFQLIRGLVRDPAVLLLDLSDCSYGREFVDGLQRVVKRCHGRTTLLIGGGGRALSGLCEQTISLSARLPGGQP